MIITILDGILKDPVPDGRYSIKKYRRVRSEQQNRYYWGFLVKPMLRKTGYSKEEMHNVLKHECNLKIKMIETLKGVREIHFVGSTAELETGEFEDYLRRCREWSAITIGVYIPLPNECLGEGFDFNL